MIFNRAKGGTKKGGKKSSTSNSSIKGPNQANVVNEEVAGKLENDHGEEEVDEILEAAEEPNMFVDEFGVNIDDFYETGSSWHGTFVLYDVMESSTSTDNMQFGGNNTLMYGMVDSGASATVCGMSWYRKWIKEVSDQPLDSPDKQFRF